MSKEGRVPFESIAEIPNLALTVKGEGYAFINDDEFKSWSDAHTELNDYLKNNSGEDATEQVKDELYNTAQEKWGTSFGKAGLFNDIMYNLVLNRDEYQLLSTILRDKLEYDINSLFFVMEFDRFIVSQLAPEKAGQFIDDVTPKLFPISQTDMTLLYSLLATYKVKGLKKSTYTFANIIRRIGDISKVINHMTNANQELSKTIQNWVTLWDKNVVVEGDVLVGAPLNDTPSVGE